MKFAQLPIGSRFRYQDRIYHKTSPLAAGSDDGGQRIIPRSAGVEPLDAAAPDDAPATPLHDALEHHHALCRTLLQQAAHDGEDGLAPLLQRLDAAQSALLLRI